MKRNKSILSKIIGKNAIDLDPGDILYSKKSKCYWIYLGKDKDIEADDSVDASKDDIVHVKCGLWTSDYISKLSFEPEKMFKVNDDIVFHFKFTSDRTLDSIISQVKSEDEIYIMTLKDDELSALNAAYTLYDIKNSNKRS